MNNSIARNKLSCTLDPRRPEAYELFMRLVAQSDIVIENLKSTTFHQMGLQDGELLDLYPRLLVVRLPPAGLTGDWSKYTGFGGQFDGLTGLAFLTGPYGSELVDTPTTTYMDGVTGPACAFAIAAALHYRDATGRGQVIEMAQSENVLNHLGDVFVHVQLGGEAQRLGNREHGASPQGVFACANGKWLAISTPDDVTWQALATTIGRPDLASDPALATEAGRYERYDELEAVLTDWCAARDVMSTFHELQAAGIPAAPLYDDELLLTDPNVQAREWIRPLRGTDVGEYFHLGHALSGLPQVWERASPSLGEDNEYVFKKLLGLDDARYAELADMGIIVQDYLDRDGNPV
jgi:crotonobetainyl-CoA:carnitine CoA-transferase CaiB-like acyl-CoA transferase